MSLQIAAFCSHRNMHSLSSAALIVLFIDTNQLPQGSLPAINVFRLATMNVLRKVTLLNMEQSGFQGTKKIIAGYIFLVAATNLSVSNLSKTVERFVSPRINQFDLNFISRSPMVANIVCKKVRKLREVLNVRVTAGHRPAQAQEEPAGWERFSRFCLKSQKFLQNKIRFFEFQCALLVVL